MDNDIPASWYTFNMNAWSSSKWPACKQWGPFVRTHHGWLARGRIERLQLEIVVYEAFDTLYEKEWGWRLRVSHGELWLCLDQRIKSKYPRSICLDLRIWINAAKLGKWCVVNVVLYRIGSSVCMVWGKKNNFMSGEHPPQGTWNQLAVYTFRPPASGPATHRWRLYIRSLLGRYRLPKQVRS